MDRSSESAPILSNVKNVCRARRYRALRDARNDLKGRLKGTVLKSTRNLRYDSAIEDLSGHDGIFYQNPDR
jgi:hypothetical protein